MDEVQSQKEALNDRLCANNEAVGRVQAEINTACSDSNKPGKLEIFTNESHPVILVGFRKETRICILFQPRSKAPQSFN